MLKLTAIIRLRGPERGGLRAPVTSGIRPSFNYDGQLVACEIRVPGQDMIPIEHDVEVSVALPYGDQLPWSIKPGDRFHLNVASQVIADGTVLFIDE